MFKRLWPLFRSKCIQREPMDPWESSTPVVSFGRKDTIKIGQVLEGIGIVGGTGAGKTSGSGQLFAKSFLSLGFGGLVLAAKKEERQLWERYCAETGRLDDLIIFSPRSGHSFSFLDYELHRGGEGAGLTENIVNIFSTMIEVAEKQSNKGGNSGEQYWQRALRQLLRNLTDLLVMAKGRLSVPELYQLTVSAPTSLEQVRSDAWRKSSFCFRCLSEADKREKTPTQLEDFKLVADYFLLEFPALSEKTRSVIVSTFTSMADVLNRGILRQLFCGATTVTPFDIELGKILLVDIPVKDFGDVGLFANILWKNSFQRSIERRDVAFNGRPMFLWQDEAQLFLTDFDMQFQQTARSSRVANVLLTQSISNFLAVTGEGQKGKAQVDSLFGNLNLKIFHANGDAATNIWASEMLGKTRQMFFNGNTSTNHDDAYSSLYGGGNTQSSGGYSEQMAYELEPSVFTKLRTGGPAHKWLVDAFLFSPVMCFKTTGKNYMPVTFSQR